MLGRGFNNKTNTVDGILKGGQWSADTETPGSPRHPSEVAEWDVMEVLVTTGAAPT